MPQICSSTLDYSGSITKLGKRLAKMRTEIQNPNYLQLSGRYLHIPIYIRHIFSYIGILKNIQNKKISKVFRQIDLFHRMPSMSCKLPGRSLAAKYSARTEPVILFCFAVKFNHKFLMMILIQSINHLKWTERILYEIKMIDVE